MYRKITEYQLHVQFWQWCCYNKLDKYLFAVEHGEIRDPRVGAKLKRKGVKPGMADYLFMAPNSKYHCLWIEIKIGKNKQSKAQLEFEEICKKCNQSYKLCYSLDELIITLQEYIKG